MKQLIQHIIPSLRIIEIAGDTNKFEQWLKEYHNKELTNDLLAGYKFFIECAFSDFFYSVSIEDEFEIDTDFLLNRAIVEATYPLDKLPHKDNCERITFLKNIYSYFKPLLKAKSATGVQTHTQHFIKNVSKLFEEVFENNFELINNETSIGKVNQLLLIENLYIHFTHINNNGPVAYSGNLMKSFWIPEKKLKYSFEGYKFTLQYLWHSILSKSDFERSELNKLHKTNSWRDYIYTELSPDTSDFDMIFGRTLNVDDQNSLDSYKYHIKEKIIPQIKEDIQFDIFNISRIFKRNNKLYSKIIFNNLLSNDKLKDPKLDYNDKIGMSLYWYPLEVFEPSQMHNGAPAFITSLAGTIALFENNNETELEKVFVCKFTHPIEDNKNNYSYGILIDSMAAAGHYSSGWLLYYDCCGDYSGFSGAEFKKVENLIKKYTDNGIVELRELKVEKNIFRKYIANHIYTSDELTKEKIRNAEQELEEHSRKQELKVDDVFGKAKAIILELLMYYAINKNEKPDIVEWSVGKDDGEIDILVINNNKLKLIECKVNPNSYDLIEEYKDLKDKLDKPIYAKYKHKECEFWFWYEPSKENTKLLKDNRIKYEYIKSIHRMPSALNGVDLDTIKYIMNYRF